MTARSILDPLSSPGHCDGWRSVAVWLGPGSGHEQARRLAHGSEAGERYSLGNLLRLVPLHAFLGVGFVSRAGLLFVSGCPGTHGNDNAGGLLGRGSGGGSVGSSGSVRIARALGFELRLVS